MKESIQKDVNADRMTALLTWLRSPLSSRISQLEVQANAPEAIVEIKEFAAGLGSVPPPPQRVALVQRLDEAAGSTALSVDLLIATIQSEAKFNPDNDELLKPGALEKQVDMIRTEWRPRMRDFTLIQMLFAYRSLSDDDLMKYIQFYESGHGQ